MGFNKYAKSKSFSGGQLVDLETDNTPEMNFVSIFLKMFYSYSEERKICSKFEFHPNFCSSTFDCLVSSFNMVLPYLYTGEDERGTDTIRVRINGEYKTVNAVEFIEKELILLSNDLSKLYIYNLKKRIEFMQRADFLYSRIPKYFIRMGIGKEDLVEAEMIWSRQGKKNV